MGPMRFKRINGLYTAFSLGAVTVLLFCSRDYNPFTDLTNAKAHVLAWGFAGKDLVPLYSTAAMKIVVALSEEVDSFDLSAKKNRFWEDTVIRMDPNPNTANGGPYFFPVSFFDTGVQKVTIRTYRSNGEVIPDEYSVRVYNPLHQEPVSQIYGVAFQLSSPAVIDRDVQYHWLFGPGREISSLTASKSALFTSGQIQGAGILWVTDLSDGYATPADSFSYTFNDTSKPVIYYFNDSLNRDTLFAGDSIFVFRVHIIDNVNRTVDTSSVNNGPFDFLNARTNVYTKIIKDIFAYSRQTGPLAITVYAMDNQQFRNTTRRTFYAFYDPSGEKNPDAKVVFQVPLEDSVSYNTPDIIVSGTAENYRTETMIARIAVNDSVYTEYIPIQGKSGTWQWSVRLRTGTNTVTVTAYSTENRLLAADTAIITYDPDFVDNIKPMIWGITTADGRTAGNLFTRSGFEELTVIAFDEGSRVQTVRINDVSARPVNDDRYIWSGNTGTLLHRPAGNAITVRVSDMAGNYRDSVFVIYKNAPPVFVQAPLVPATFCIDTEYTLRFSYYDADNDPITLQCRHKPASMTVTTDGRCIWTPRSIDAGDDSLVIGFLDGYEETPDTAFYFSIVDCSRPDSVNTVPTLLKSPALPVYACIDSAYRFNIASYDPDNDLVDVIALHAPEGMSVSKRGLVQWNPVAAGSDSLVIRLYDQKEYSAPWQWPLTVLDCSRLPSGVQFLTGEGEFSGVIQVGRDSIDLLLRTEPGTGEAPFTYQARFMSGGIPVLDNDTTGRLNWKPLISDTGSRVLLVSVTDRYHRADTITPAFSVVPHNQYPCSLSYVYSGTTVSPGIVSITYPAQPEILSFTINDLDHPLTERYTVDIVKDRVRSSQVLTGDTKGFILTISASSIFTVDTIKVSVKDSTGSADTVTIVIRYQGLSLKLYLNTTASGAGVGGNVTRFPILVRLTGNNYDFSDAQVGEKNIRFRKSDGTPLPYEIERWDSSAGLAEIWVLADTVYGNDSGHYVELYHADRPAIHSSNPGAVFDTANGFRGVWHQDEASGEVIDATVLENDGIRFGNQQQTAGVIGMAQLYDGNGDYTEMGNVLNPGDADLTVSAWVKRESLDAWHTIISKTNGGNPNFNYGWILTVDNSNALHFYIADGGFSWGDVNAFEMYANTPLTDLTSWHFVSAVIPRSSNADCRLYIDGAETARTARGMVGSIGNVTNTEPLRIGVEADDQCDFKGSIDEMVVSFAARSADWIKLCYMNQKSVDALITFR
jgi:hypothetical protein